MKIRIILTLLFSICLTSCTPEVTPALAPPSSQEPTAIDVILQPVAFNLNIFTAPGLADNEIKITVTASTKLSGVPETYLTQNGANSSPVHLSYDANLRAYTGTAMLDANLPASGTIIVKAIDISNNVEEMATQFALEAVAPGMGSEVRSSDGHVTLYLPPGSLSANGQVNIADAQDIGSLPGGMILLDGPYALQGNEGLALVKNANLTLTYMRTEEELSHVDINSAKIYFWDGKSWQALSSTSDPDFHEVSASIKTFGTYAILAHTLLAYP